MAGTTAWKENDAKKIVAISTLSQLGVIAFALSFGTWKLCFFHITTHAIFKALLFITTGYNIEINLGAQRKNSIFLPISKIYPIINTANLSLIGVPFLSGFYSKDLIIENCTTKESNLFTTTIFVLACVLTSTYTFILIITVKNSKNISLLSKEEKKKIKV